MNKIFAVTSIILIAFASGYGSAPAPQIKRIYVETQVPVCAAMPIKYPKLTSAANGVAAHAIRIGK